MKVIASDLHEVHSAATSTRTSFSFSAAASQVSRANKQQKQEAGEDLPISTSPLQISFEHLPTFEDKYLERVFYVAIPSLLYPQCFTPSTPPRGMLLTGPGGVGKTALAHAVANRMLKEIPTLSFASTTGTALITSKTGESENLIRSIFRYCCDNAPCLLVVDNIDACAAPAENAAREFERRIISQFCTSFDESSGVFVLATAESGNRIDKMLRRPGRFDYETELTIPTRGERASIIEAICQLGADDSERVACVTPGFVHADLQALHREALLTGFKKRGIASVTLPMLALEDFLAAARRVEPLLRKDGIASVPDICLDDIGGLEGVKEDLRLNVLLPIQNPQYYAELGIKASAGVILFGAPGNGKTLLGKALANMSECNFISVKGPELLNEYVGESERAVRTLFERARAARPVIVFLDECECLCRVRGGGSNSEVTDRVVNQFLTELDGVSSDREGVFVIAATNRVDLIDRAILRPGRLEKAIYVDLPDANDRADILWKTLSRCRISGVTREMLADMCADLADYSGADIAAIAREAGLRCVERHGESITAEDIQYGRGKVRRSVSDADLKYYKAEKAGLWK